MTGVRLTQQGWNLAGGSCTDDDVLEQIPGVDFTESYSPVVNDITWRILIVLMILLELEAKIIDIETAFLYGEFEDGEEIYMDCPPGLEHKEYEVLRLLKTIYGLVQASRQYFKKFTKILKGMGFQGGDVDPCLFYKESKENGTVYIGIYVDDCLVFFFFRFERDDRLGDESSEESSDESSDDPSIDDEYPS